MMKQILIIIIIFCGIILPSFSFASETNGTIDSSYKYAWGENLGWINMKSDDGNILITDSAITGYAWSTFGGWINFSPANGGVTNTSLGVLGGSAWSSQKGWINMTGVTIDLNGKFVGTAGTEGTVSGRITFSCDHCDVRTDWRPSSSRISQSTSGSIISGTSNTTTTTDTPLIIELIQIGEDESETKKNIQIQKIEENTQNSIEEYLVIQEELPNQPNISSEKSTISESFEREINQQSDKIPEVLLLESLLIILILILVKFKLKH